MLLVGLAEERPTLSLKPFANMSCGVKDFSNCSYTVMKWNRWCWASEAGWQNDTTVVSKCQLRAAHSPKQTGTQPTAAECTKSGFNIVRSRCCWQNDSTEQHRFETHSIASLRITKETNGRTLTLNSASYRLTANSSKQKKLNTVNIERQYLDKDSVTHPQSS